MFQLPSPHPPPLLCPTTTNLWPNSHQSESKAAGWCQFYPHDDDDDDDDDDGGDCVLKDTMQVSSLDHEEDFSETVEKMEEIVKAQSSVVFQPNQTFPFLKDLDLESVYR